MAGKTLKFADKKIYKENTPIETIKKIRQILYENDIFVYEHHFLHKVGVASSRLQLGDGDLCDADVGTNGKGMNGCYSMASAYAEMMERIQSSFLLIRYIRSAVKNGDLEYMFMPNEQYLTIKELPPESIEVLHTLLNHQNICSDENFSIDFMMKQFGDSKYHCLYFTDVFSGEKLLLPYDFIMDLVGSNGCCAGNSRREALVQGISEIYERAALRDIYINNPVLPKIPLQSFVETKVYGKLWALEESGIKCDILDASLGKNYPVVGLRVETKMGGVNFGLGADPCISKALERCLTELHQTSCELEEDPRCAKESCGLLKNKKTERSINLYLKEYKKSLHSLSGLKPDNIFYLSDVCSEGMVESNEGLDEDLSYFLTLTKNLGYQLYTIDFSFLGFPTFFTIIPQISSPGIFSLEDAVKISQINPMDRKDLPGYFDVVKILRKIYEKHSDFIRSHAN